MTKKRLWLAVTERPEEFEESSVSLHFSKMSPTLKKLRKSHKGDLQPEARLGVLILLDLGRLLSENPESNKALKSYIAMK